MHIAYSMRPRTVGICILHRLISWWPSWVIGSHGESVDCETRKVGLLCYNLVSEVRPAESVHTCKTAPHDHHCGQLSLWIEIQQLRDCNRTSILCRQSKMERHDMGHDPLVHWCFVCLHIPFLLQFPRVGIPGTHSSRPHLGWQCNTMDSSI